MEGMGGAEGIGTWIGIYMKKDSLGFFLLKEKSTNFFDISLESLIFLCTVIL